MADTPEAVASRLLKFINAADAAARDTFRSELSEPKAGAPLDRRLATYERCLSTLTKDQLVALDRIIQKMPPL